MRGIAVFGDGIDTWSHCTLGISEGAVGTCAVFFFFKDAPIHLALFSLGGDVTSMDIPIGLMCVLEAVYYRHFTSRSEGDANLVELHSLARSRDVS